MPNCDFFAAGTDHQQLLAHVLTQGDADIYASDSKFGQPLRQFRSLSDFEEHFSITDWRIGATESILLQLYPHGAKGRFVARRIGPMPRSTDKVYRYAAEGWGLVQLYLEPPRKGILRASHTNHNSVARAEAWSETIRYLGKPSAWDWQRVASFSRGLNRYIRKLAVAKVNSRVILPNAAALQKQGVELG